MNHRGGRVEVDRLPRAAAWGAVVASTAFVICRRVWGGAKNFRQYFENVCIFKISYVYLHIEINQTADGPKADIMTNYINSYDRVKNAIESGKALNIYNLICGDFISKNSFEYSDEADIIFELVAKKGEGFVIDICNRVRESMRSGKAIILSDKQRWCIAFAAIKISAEAVDSLREADGDNSSRGNDVSAEEIKTVNEYQESGRVFIHLNDGRTICRMMTSKEVQTAQRIRAREGMKAFKTEIARLFNGKYREAQRANRVTTAEDEQLGLLRTKRDIIQLTEDEEFEYQHLLNQDY